MKKYISIFILMFLINNFTCFAFDFVSLQPSFLKNKNEKDVYSIVKKHSNAIKKRDCEKIKTFYDDAYINTDGFDLADLIEMLNKTHSSYKNMKYKIDINNVMAYDNWALVQMSDKTKATVYADKEEKNKKKTGVLEGKSAWNLYLKKNADGWKIISEEILMEETSLKYGIAKKIDMDLITPMFVKNGKEYDISLKINNPKDTIALASISKEEITYPPKDCEDRFRKMPENGDLERVFRANDKNINEYGVASVGFAKVSVNEEETRAKIEILGIAYIMKRINIEKNNNDLLTKGAN